MKIYFIDFLIKVRFQILLCHSLFCLVNNFGTHDRFDNRKRTAPGLVATEARKESSGSRLFSRRLFYTRENLYWRFTSLYHLRRERSLARESDRFSGENIIFETKKMIFRKYHQIFWTFSISRTPAEPDIVPADNAIQFRPCSDHSAKQAGYISGSL